MRSGAPVWDAIVVGSGPAGATAALHLARRRLRVLILEKQSWPRYKTCGGGLVRRARRHLDVAIEDSIEEETYRAELHLHDPAATFSVTRRQPLVSMTMRSDLDDALVAAAKQAGAEMRDCSAVSHIDRATDPLTVSTEDGSFRARYLVVADGASGTTAQLAGWTRRPRLIPALESEILVDRATRERFAAVARFDFDLVPAGYSWVFPKKEGLSVGCLSRSRHQPDLKRHLVDYLRRLEIQSPVREDHGFVIPVSPRSRLLAEDRVLLTGDSAGLADPVTCEGISNAILSGKLAATAIADHESAPETVLLTYQRSLESSILRDLRYARVLARFLYEMPRVRRFAFQRTGQTLSEAMVRIICDELSYRELLASPTRYLRAVRRYLGRPGAYPKG